MPVGLSDGETIPDSAGAGAGSVGGRESLLDAPRSFYFYGESRMLANVVAHAVARWLDPDFLWVEVVDRSEGRDGGERARTGWVEPNRRHYLYRASDLPPTPPPSAAAISRLLKEGEGGPTRARISDFVQFPEALQELVAREAHSGPPHVLLLSNTDFTEEFYPPGPGTFRPFLRVAAEENVTVICSRRGGERPNRFDFDIVVRLESVTGPSSEQLRLRVEKGLPGSPFPNGATLAPEEVPPVAEALRAL